MACTFAQRLGAPEGDYVPALEKAASRNFFDGERLRKGKRSLGAIYHYGYCVEMLVKVAYFRMTFNAHHPPLPLSTTRIDSTRRRAAFRETDGHGRLLVPGMIGQHDFSSWARLLTIKRALLATTNLAVAYNPTMANEIRNRADRVYDHWKEYMRYRAFPVRTAELATVRDDADWFRHHYSTL